MKNIRFIYLGVVILIIPLSTACKKDWLNAKPNQSLVVPTTVADYQALLDAAFDVMNLNQPSLVLTSDGDYHVADTRYNRLTQTEKSAYIWAPTSDNFYGGSYSPDWQFAYNRILNENVVLDGITGIKATPGMQAAYNNVKGSALFYRSYDFYCLSQEFCKLYNAQTASTDLGLVLRTSSNVNITLSRSSVQQTYNQIINDLLISEHLLPNKPLVSTRPSKAAVYGLLSRVYLSQQNYNKALLYSDSCLKLQNSLMDFNQLDPTADFPIQVFNSEVIFDFNLAGYTSFLKNRLIADSVLFGSYAISDLRASIYFINESGNNEAFRGSYTGGGNFFGGLATDEMYLTRAECYARAGNTNAAMNDLNTLLKTRWVMGTYTSMTAPDAGAALAIILTERRKELCFRALRWTDLRRLNTDPRFQVTLTRVVNGQTYTLEPNSPRYILPLDPIEINLGGLQQNPR